MSRRLPAFTREDEKELFRQDVDSNFLDEFRRTYGSNAESCTLEFQANVANVSVEEFEDVDLNGNGDEIAKTFDIYTVTLKVPVGVRTFAEQGNKPNFLMFLANQITDVQWRNVLQDNTNKYKCAVCRKIPDEARLVSVTSALKKVTEHNSCRVHLYPCFPVCDSDRCHLIASRCIDKFYDNMASVSGEESLSSSKILNLCAHCGRCENKETKLLKCSRCNQTSYCNAECQKAHWPKHKKACKLVTCQYCEKLETVKLFAKCSRCQRVFYCGSDCQRADWANHKKMCKKANT
jgi:hypothetical protein